MFIKEKLSMDLSYHTVGFIISWQIHLFGCLSLIFLVQIFYINRPSLGSLKTLIFQELAVKWSIITVWKIESYRIYNLSWYFYNIFCGTTNLKFFKKFQQKCSPLTVRAQWSSLKYYTWFLTTAMFTVRQDYKHI